MIGKKIESILDIVVASVSQDTFLPALQTAKEEFSKPIACAVMLCVQVFPEYSHIKYIKENVKV